MYFIVRITQSMYVTNLSKMKEINHSDVVFLWLFTFGSTVFIKSDQIFLLCS